MIVPILSHRFITFEGGEGSGKTTQINRLAERLTAMGETVTITREPGGCPLAEQIRQWLVSGQPEAIHEKTELLLLTAARIEHVRQVIQPALQRGGWVLCDRFFDSTLVYQGFGRGLDQAWIARLHQWALGPFTPALTVLLDVDPEVGLARSHQKQRGRTGSSPPETRFEMENLRFHQTVRSGFRTLAAGEPERFRVMDAAGRPGEIAERVWEVVRHAFSRS